MSSRVLLTAAVVACAGCHLVIAHQPAAPVDAGASEARRVDLRDAAAVDQRVRDAPRQPDAARLDQPPVERPPDQPRVDLRPPDQRPPDLKSPDLCPPVGSGGGAHVWTLRFGKNNTRSGSMNYPDIGRAVAARSIGTVVFAGSTASQSLWLGDPGSAKLPGTEGFDDAIVGSYSASGAYQWATRFGGTAVDQALAIALSPGGSVYVAGQFASSQIVIGAEHLANAGAEDIFLASYSSNGAPGWSKAFGSIGSDGAFALATGQSSIYVAGAFSNTVDFEGTLSKVLTSAGAQDIFVAAFDTVGKHQWSQRFGGPGADAARGLALDSAGNLYVTGTYSNTVNFGGVGRTSAGYEDVFLLSLTPAGGFRWAKGLGGAGSDYGQAVAADGAGNLYATGYFSGTISVEGKPITSHGAQDILLTSFTSAGTHRWSQGLGGANDDRGQAIAAAPDGTIYLTGGVTGSVDLGGGPLPAIQMTDPFVASFSTCGAHRWSKAFNAAADASEGLGIALGGGAVYFSGRYQGFIDFGGGAQGSVGTDLFIVKLTP